MAFATIKFRSNINEEFDFSGKYNYGYFLTQEKLKSLSKYISDNSDRNMINYWYSSYYIIKVFPSNIKKICYNRLEEKHFTNLCILHEMVHAITVAILHISEGHDKYFLKYLSKIYKNYCRINHLNFYLVSKYMIESYIFRNKTQAQKLLIRDDWYDC